MCPRWEGLEATTTTTQCHEHAGRGIPAPETLSTVNRAGRMLLAKWLEGGRPQRPPRKRQRQDRALCVNRKSSQSQSIKTCITCRRCAGDRTLCLRKFPYSLVFFYGPLLVKKISKFFKISKSQGIVPRHQEDTTESVRAHAGPHTAHGGPCPGSATSPPGGSARAARGRPRFGGAAAPAP